MKDEFAKRFNQRVYCRSESNIAVYYLTKPSPTRIDLESKVCIIANHLAWLIDQKPPSCVIAKGFGGLSMMFRALNVLSKRSSSVNVSQVFALDPDRRDSLGEFNAV